MRALSTGLLALLLVPTSAPVPGIAVSMTDVTGGNSSSAPSMDGCSIRGSCPAWGTHADSLRAEACCRVRVRRPLERFLGRYNTDRVLVRRISRAVLRESRRQQVPPSLIAAVLVTENTTLRPEARSSVGAQGLMQVMPMHAGPAVPVERPGRRGQQHLPRHPHSCAQPEAHQLLDRGAAALQRLRPRHQHARLPALPVARAGARRHCAPRAAGRHHDVGTGSPVAPAADPPDDALGRG